MSKKMPLNARQKSISFSLKALSAAVLTAVLVSNASAAGLGKLTVLSSLGQPLHAEIELTAVSADEAGSLVPKLASTEAFRQANIEFNPALFSMRFAVEQRGTKQFIRVTSTQPINEPFVDLLLELGGTGSRLVREYTFLLDPVDLRSTQSAQVTATAVPAPAVSTRVPQATPSPQPQVVTPPVAAEKPTRAERPSQQPAGRTTTPVSMPKSEQPSGGDYQVKSGDTLSRIAGKVKPQGISLDQMLVALYRANPDAFAGNNMNRLRAGQILQVPNESDAGVISNPEARGVIVAQAADFNSYRNKLAGQIATAAPAKSTEGKQSATGKITAKVEEQPTPANEAKDKLKLSKPGTGPVADKNSKIAAGSEDRIAKDKAAAEANARVKELEKNVSELQKVLEIKNKELADKQKQADAAATKIAAAPAAAAKPAVAPTPAPVAPAPAPVVDAKPAVVKPAEPKVDKPAAPVTAAPAPSASAQAPVAVAKPKPKQAAPVVPESSLMDDLTSPYVLGGAALALLAIGGAFVYSSRRKKQALPFDESIITDSSLKANSLFGSTGGQSVDTNNSVFNSNFAPSVGQLDTNEVDPVAEADVYIAYGRDAQAEEILKEALRTQPERNAVRVKLLEIYANRKDARSFEILASELYSMTKGEGEDWLQAATLGNALDPNNPLYASGKLPEDGVGKASAMMAPTQPMVDHPDDLEALLATTQLNQSLETINTIEDSTYFGNTAIATEVPERKPEPAPLSVPDLDFELKPEAKAAAPETLDFDLEGLGAEDTTVQPAASNPAPVDIKAELDSIDFDFLQQEDAPTAAPVTAAAAPAAHDVDDLSSMLADIHAGNEMPAAAAAKESGGGALDFDLSGITLELNPAEAKADAIARASDADDGPSGSDAEMATKLDLAVAYQEIGDKDGARELLDEVLKGGSPEQSDKAKSLLAKLG